MLIGYDGGYGFIKTSEGFILPSKLTNRVTGLDEEEAYKLKYNGKTYLVGMGSYDTDLNRIHNESFTAFMLTALAMSSDDVDHRVVTGLPIKQYKQYKDDLKNTILSNRVYDFEIGGAPRRIIIDDVYIFPQGLGAFYSLPNDMIEDYSGADVVLIDIGTRTVDITLMEEVKGQRKVTKYNSILEGTVALYNDLIHAINDEYELDLKIEDAERILKRGLFVRGKKQSLSFAKDVITQHTSEIFKELDLNYPVTTGAVLLAGGGGYLYNGLFKKKYSHAQVIPDAQLANCIGYKKVGESIWQR